MALWTIADVRFLAPEFTVGVVSDVDVQKWIDMADRRLDTSAFGASGVDAGAYLTAHLMTLAGVGGLGPYVGGGALLGRIQGQTVGQVSVTYATTFGAAGVLKYQPDLSLTKYGILYADLVFIAGLGLQTIGMVTF